MNTDIPFIIDNPNADFENHIEENENQFPFEFTATNVWDGRFFPPENNSFDALRCDIADIRQIVNDIKQILCDMFEYESDTE